MVWRIHFTPDDLARIQVSPTLGPLAETMMAVTLLRCPAQPRALLSEWRGLVQGRITPRMKPLTALIPPGTRGVDLCTLTGEAATIEQGVQLCLKPWGLTRCLRLPARPHPGPALGRHHLQLIYRDILAAACEVARARNTAVRPAADSVRCSLVRAALRRGALPAPARRPIDL